MGGKDLPKAKKKKKKKVNKESMTLFECFNER